LVPRPLALDACRRDLVNHVPDERHQVFLKSRTPARTAWVHESRPVTRPMSNWSSDSIAVRAVASVRVVVAVAIGLIGSFLPNLGAREDAFFLIVGFVWIPFATVVLFASVRPNRRVALIGGPVGDILVLLGAQCLLPGASRVVLILYVVVVAFGVYTAGKHFATLLGAVAIACTALSQGLIPRSARLGAAELLFFSLALLAILLLLARSATLQDRVNARAERLQTKSDTILTHVASAVFVTDAESKILECNPAAERIVELPANAVVGNFCGDVVGLHLGERALDCSGGCAILKEFSESEAILGCELWRTRADGKRQPLLADATTVASASGQLEVVHSLRDVTRLKEAEEAKTMFLATASHELKTPLTVITGFAETLIRFDDIDRDTRLAALDAIRSRTRELTQIVDRLLMSSRIGAGAIQVTCTEMDVVPIISDRFATFAAGTHRAVTFMPPTEPVLAFANRDALITVIDHLIDNAAKYSASDQTISIEVASRDGRAHIVVVDQGIGMDEEQAAHCFKQFWQAESNDARRFGGTGIGLYIVHSLVEAMGGQIEVRSRKGHGSAFTVTLRRVDVDDAPAPSAGEESSIREFMRQIGVPERSRA